MTKDLNYEINNIGYDATGEEGIKCKNYVLCGATLPLWWFECKGHYLCINCDVMFGTWGPYVRKGILDLCDSIECPICLENKKGISYPSCDHFACIDCFKRCFYGDNSGQPVFPYPEIEDEYYNDEDNIKWKTTYPLISLYNKEWYEWENNRMEREESEKHLTLCPLCRK